MTTHILIFSQQHQHLLSISQQIPEYINISNQIPEYIKYPEQIYYITLITIRTSILNNIKTIVSNT